MIDTPISQISGLAKLDNASFMASLALPPSATVIPVTATKVIAKIDKAPMGIALPIIAAITPTNNASKFQAWSVTPSGVGIKRIVTERAMAMTNGMGLKPIFTDIFIPIYL